MKRQILLLALVLMITLSFSQPSGYLGKRFNASYSGMTFPNFFHMGEDDVNLMNYTNNVTLEWVVEQRQSIGLKVQSFNVNGYVEGYTSDFLKNSTTTDYSNEIDDVYSLNVLTVSFEYTIYQKGWIAPLGKYNKIGFMYLQYSSKDYLVDNPELVNVEEKVMDYTFAFTYTKGKKWIFNDIFTLHVASQVGFVLPTFYLNGSRRLNQFQFESDKRLFSYTFFNFEVGVGVLF